MAITRVTTDGITDSAVSTAKIGANAVDTTKIGADVIVADDIADNAITVAQIQDGAVTAAKLAPGAAVPDQTGHSGQYLTTDGTTADWAAVPAYDGIIPSSNIINATVSGNPAVWEVTANGIPTNHNEIKYSFWNLSVGGANENLYHQVHAGASGRITSGYRQTSYYFDESNSNQYISNGSFAGFMLDGWTNVSNAFYGTMTYTRVGGNDYVAFLNVYNQGYDSYFMQMNGRIGLSNPISGISFARAGTSAHIDNGTVKIMWR